MRTLTIRRVPKRLADALTREKQRRGASLNQTVLDVLSGGLGVGVPGGRHNGLRRLSGTWSSSDREEFDAAVAAAEQIDDDLWR